MKFVSRLYKSVLFLSLTLMPSAALAGDAVIDGSKKTTDVVINTLSPTWTELISTVVLLPADTEFYCEVTCTSTVNNPFNPGGDQDYYYAAANLTNPASSDGCV